jgi:biopolymer transport protein ExbD
MRHRRRRRAATAIPQASLPDLAFLLLIFFITSTVFAVERGLPMLLPSARRSPTLSVEPSEVFRIQGFADGRVTADGRPVALGEIAPLLRARNQARRARGQPELVVIVQTHPQAEYETMVGILDQVRAADSRRVALQVMEGG